MKGKVSITYKPERQKLTNQQKRAFIAANSRAFGGQLGVREICEQLHIGTRTYTRLKNEVVKTSMGQGNWPGSERAVADE